YEETAVKEAEEETGLKINPEDLKLVTTIRHTAHDEITGKINNVIRRIYVYEYNGPISELKIEQGKATGFEAVKIDSLFDMSEEEKKKFIPIFFEEENQKIFRKIKELA
ncbi:MAG: NUDIX domain-containing protein, partial [Patescibacteria group bacterium]